MQANGNLTLLAVGDLMINRPKPASAFEKVRPILKQADILLGNQEVPVSDRGEPAIYKTEGVSRPLRSVLGAIQAEAEVGFSAVSLANNHMLDYGEEGLFQTIQLLQESNIKYAGAGKSLMEARAPALLERRGLRVAMLSYTSVFPEVGFAARSNRPGVATIKVQTSYQPPRNYFYQPGTPPLVTTTPDATEMEAMVEDVRKARGNADLVVVQFHWGVTRIPQVLGYMKQAGRAAVDAGADIILGHHPHLLLGCELYRGRPICYSLNQFAFDVYDVSWPGWFDSVVFKAVISRGRVERCSFIPIAIDEKSRVPEPATGDRRQGIADSLARLSQEFQTKFTSESSELVLEKGS